jgi:hypothetical protein
LLLLQQSLLLLQLLLELLLLVRLLLLRLQLLHKTLQLLLYIATAAVLFAAAIGQLTAVAVTAAAVNSCCCGCNFFSWVRASGGSRAAIAPLHPGSSP